MNWTILWRPDIDLNNKEQVDEYEKSFKVNEWYIITYYDEYNEEQMMEQILPKWTDMICATWT